MTETPATIHRRSAAILRHVVNDDYADTAVLLPEAVTDPQLAIAQMISLAQFFKRLMEHTPPGELEQFLNDSAVALAQAEHGGIGSP